MKLSLVIPTYNEKENIQNLLFILREEFSRNKIDYEIIIVDDNSPDGTGKVLEELKTKYKNIKVIHRMGKLGLSSAVVDGFKIASGDIFGVMDADLSHSPEKIKEMYQILMNDVDLVIGSRYIEGGRIEGWNMYRKILSKGATLLARVFVDVKDPMSGFFLFKKGFIIHEDINSKGFKILLELLIKGNFKKIKEIPITFNNRTVGKSKASVKEIVSYLRNLFGYLFYKKDIMVQIFKFGLVGFVGTVINISILYISTEYFKIYYLISAFFSFFIASSSNFIFNKIWTFKEKIGDNLFIKYIRFLSINFSALAVNVLFLYIFTEFFHIYYIVSEIMAIGIAFIINFIGNKIWTFHK